MAQRKFMTIKPKVCGICCYFSTRSPAKVMRQE